MSQREQKIISTLSRYKRLFYSIAYNFFLKPEDIEDLYQEFSLKVIYLIDNNLPTNKNYIFSVIINIINKHLQTNIYPSLKIESIDKETKQFSVSETKEMPNSFLTDLILEVMLNTYKTVLKLYAIYGYKKIMEIYKFDYNTAINFVKAAKKSFRYYYHLILQDKKIKPRRRRKIIIRR